MGNIGYGFRILFRIWRDAQFADQIKDLEAGKLMSMPAREPQPVAPPKTRRSDALTLLSMLQREARLIDFIKEPIASYSDAQIGAAVRDVHKNCATVLERAFAIQPLSATPEGAAIDVPRGFDPAQYRLTGQVPNQPPYHGTLRHQGWRASKCELPEWTGSNEAKEVIAPAEVEIK